MKKYICVFLCTIPLLSPNFLKASSVEGELRICQPGQKGHKKKQNYKKNQSDEVMNMMRKMMAKIESVEKKVENIDKKTEDFKKEMRQEMKEMRQEMVDFEAKNNTQALLESADEVLSWPKLIAMGAILAFSAYGAYAVNKKFNKFGVKEPKRIKSNKK